LKGFKKKNLKIVDNGIVGRGGNKESTLFTLGYTFIPFNKASYRVFNDHI